MPNKNYEKGVRFEREIVQSFKELKFPYVTRTPGSKSPVDIIAVDSNGRTYMIQAKDKKGSVMNDLHKLKQFKFKFKDLSNIRIELWEKIKDGKDKRKSRIKRYEI